MKTKSKFSLLAVFLMMVFVANVACQEESIHKQDAKQALEQNENAKSTFGDEVKLTSDNYVTENSLHIASLEQALAVIADKKKELLADIQQGDKSAEKEFNNLVSDEKLKIIELDAVLDLEDLFYFKPKPKPNPCPQPVFCFPKNIQFLAKLSTDNITAVNLYDKTGKKIGENISEDIVLSNNKVISVLKIVTNGYVGEAEIIISKRLGNDLNTTTYSTIINIQ